MVGIRTGRCSQRCGGDKGLLDTADLSVIPYHVFSVTCLSTTNPAYGYWGVPRDREDVIRNDRKIGRI